MPMFTVHHRGAKLSCRSAGDETSRRTALLIHGLNTNMAFWHPALVRALGTSHRLLLYDQRGHGYSDMSSTGYTCRELADDALAVLDAQDVPAADVVAHSFGAGVALQLALRYPNRVRHLVILDGRLRCIQPDVRLGEWSQFPRWASHFRESGIDLDPSWELDCTLPLRLAEKDLTPHASSLAADGFFVSVYSKRTMAKYRKLLSDTSALEDFRSTTDLTRAEICQLSQPTTLIYGMISPFLPTGEALAQTIDGARLELIENAGHNFPFNHPWRTFAALERSGIWLTDEADGCAQEKARTAVVRRLESVAPAGESQG